MTSLFELPLRVPKMVVFDLDYTLWPFWVDTFMKPDFKRNSSGEVVDYRGNIIKPYPDSLKILSFLSFNNIGCSIASRTGEVAGAELLIKLFGWSKFLQHKQIYPGSKIPHITKISKESKIDYNDILFFDDEPRNIYDVERLGVVSILVEDGMTVQVLAEGMQKFSDIRTSNE